MKQEIKEWQWHQLNHMQIICTSLHTDNHAHTSLLSFYRPDAFSDTQPTPSKYSYSLKVQQKVWTLATGTKVAAD